MADPWETVSVIGPYTLKILDESEYSDGDTTLTRTHELYWNDKRLWKHSSATYNNMGGSSGTRHEATLTGNADGSATLRCTTKRIESGGAEADKHGRTEDNHVWLLQGDQMVVQESFEQPSL